jgi:hypothetical protein
MTMTNCLHPPGHKVPVVEHVHIADNGQQIELGGNEKERKGQG